MRSQKNVRVATLALVGVVLLAAIGWVAARQIKSPAQVASETAPPRASLISVPVEKRSLATEVIVRGTVRYGKPQPVALPASQLKTGAQIVSRIPKADAVIKERQAVMTISGRPVFVLQGEVPMHRDLGPGDNGEDVEQLERALSRAGFGPGSIDGRYDSATGAAVAQFYRSRGRTPFGLTEAQIDKLNTATAAVGTATDLMLQQRVALRTARRGATPAELNQARLDATAVGELLAPARAAISAARTRLAEAQDLASISKRSETQGDAAARRDVALAGVDVTAKQNLLNDAITARSEAQRAVDILPADAPPAEAEAARAALRTAAAKVPGAQAELAAAWQAFRAAEGILRAGSTTARDGGRKALRDERQARADLRAAQRTVATLERKQKLAQSRVKILKTPANTRLESEIVAAATNQVSRARAELQRLSSRAGVQVPADEILFFPTTPVRVDVVTAKRGSVVSGDVLQMSNTRLAIDSSLSPQEKNLVKPGMDVKIEEQDLRIEIKGRVNSVAAKPGTNPDLPDPGRTAFEVTPFNAPQALRNASVRLTISVKSTEGEVLTVPVGALSVGADGRSRVQVDLGDNKTRVVYVTPGLSAQGQVQVTPKGGSSLKPGDLVVVGSGPSAAGKAPTASGAPVAPAGVSTVPSAPSSSAGSGGGSSGTTTGAPAATPPSAGGTPGTGATGSTPGAGATNGGSPPAPPPATPPAAGATGTPGGTRGP